MQLIHWIHKVERPYYLSIISKVSNRFTFYKTNTITVANEFIRRKFHNVGFDALLNWQEYELESWIDRRFLRARFCMVMYLTLLYWLIQFLILRWSFSRTHFINAIPSGVSIGGRSSFQYVCEGFHYFGILYDTSNQPFGHSIQVYF